MFINTLVNKYSKISFPPQYEDLCKIDGAISWYFADTNKQYITLTSNTNTKILELDIRQAFTNICKCLFNKDSDFIQEMNKIKDKKSRNIYIATHLNNEQLKWLNIICKIIIIGTIFEISEDIVLLELKKDGVIISCDETIENIIDTKLKEQIVVGKFTEFLFNYGFEFGVNKYDKYIRSNRTSYFWNRQNLMEVKGQYKHSPPKIKEFQNKILNNEDINFTIINKIYSKEYFDIVTINNLNEIIRDYYRCDNNRFLASDGKYIGVLKRDNISPRNYLKTFLYPVILSTKI